MTNSPGIPASTPPPQKTAGKWDFFFKKHLEISGKKGIDINESVEADWGATVQWLEKYILPFITEPRPSICEIGPGTGRFSRHLFERARIYYLVDYSDYVCELLEKTFGNRENVCVIKSEHSSLGLIHDNSLDFIFSIGTFVHLYIEQIYGYFAEFYRTLREKGQCVIHFANIMDDGGYDYFVRNLSPDKQYDQRSVFRFYHPEMLEKTAIKLGFSVVSKQFIAGTRHGFLALKKTG